MLAAIAGNMSVSDKHTAYAETRGTLNCNLGETFLGNIPGAAHCLRFDPLYYQVSFLSFFLPSTNSRAQRALLLAYSQIWKSCI